MLAELISEVEGTIRVRVLVKQYSDINTHDIYEAVKEDDGYNVITEKYPLGLWHDADDVEILD